MSKYYCLDCNSTFNDPVIRDMDEFGGAVMCCPHCRSPQYVFAKQCELCGNYIDDDYIVLKDGTVVCENCYDMKSVFA